MDKALMDALFNGQAFGSVAARLLAANMDANVMRPWVEDDPSRSDFGRSFITSNGKRKLNINAATLRKDEWKHYDQAIMKAARTRLNGIQDLISRGLTYDISNGLGKMVLEYEKIGDITAAQVSMDAITRGQNDIPEVEMAYLPMPVIHKDYQLNARVLAASRTTGAPLDTTMAEFAARKVAETLESMLFTATTFTYGGGIIYSYLNEPNRNQVTLNAHWNDSAADGESMLDDIIRMKQALINKKHYGPYVVYIPTIFETPIDEDFKAGSDKPVRQRMLEVKGISDIKVVDTLTADNILMVEMTTETVRLVTGLAMQPIEWTTEGGLVTHYKVITIQVPQVRSDKEGNSGIAHGTK